MNPGNAAAIILSVISLLPLQQEKPTFSIKVTEVQIAATVKDKKGKMIPNLQKEDFLLEEEGTPQAIEHFGRQSDLALTLGLLMDTSMSQRQVLQEERRDSLQDENYARLPIRNEDGQKSRLPGLLKPFIVATVDRFDDASVLPPNPQARVMLESKRPT
jgi:hypothetical protein